MQTAATRTARITARITAHTAALTASGCWRAAACAAVDAEPHLSAVNCKLGKASGEEERVGAAEDWSAKVHSRRVVKLRVLLKRLQ